MSEIVLVVLLGVAVAACILAIRERNLALLECRLLRTRIEELERERDHYRSNVDRWAEEIATRDTRIEALERRLAYLLWAANFCGADLDAPSVRLNAPVALAAREEAMTEMPPEKPRLWTPADCRIAASNARLGGHSDVGEAFDLIAFAWEADLAHIEALGGC